MTRGLVELIGLQGMQNQANPNSLMESSALWVFLILFPLSSFCSSKKSRTLIVTGIGTPHPMITASCLGASLASCSDSPRSDIPASVPRISAVSPNQPDIRVPIWLITSGSISLGRWSITPRVTPNLRISRARIPKVVCRATSEFSSRVGTGRHTLDLSKAIYPSPSPNRTCSFHRIRLSM